MKRVDPEITLHEEAFIEYFVQKQRRERLLFELRKHRGRFLGRLTHGALECLDLRFATALPPPNSDPAAILRLLEARGAGKTCYAISSNDQIDGRILPLSDALYAAVGFGMPSILSCCPGLLAYVETEQVAGPPDRYFLTRKPSVT